MAPLTPTTASPRRITRSSALQLASSSTSTSTSATSPSTTISHPFPTKSPTHSSLRHFCRRVFFLEGWLLFASGGAMLLAPQLVLAAQGFSAAAAPADEQLSRCNLRQFGAMCVLMGFVGVFADVYPRIVQACLLGDALWVAAFLPTV